MSKKTSPRITEFSWGNLKTDEGQHYKDAKLYPGGSRAWDWNETGTQHVPGVQLADVQELVEHGAEIVILTKGVNERLQVQQQTLDMLAEQGVGVEVLQTEAAVTRYNELQQNRAVGGLFHTTC